MAAVVRGGQLHNFADPRVQRLSGGDKVVCIADIDTSIDDPSTARADQPEPSGGKDR